MALMPFPPQFQSTVRVKHRFRFQSSANSSSNITRAILLDLLMTNLTSAHTNARLISGVKLNRVELWGVSGTNASDFAAATLSLEWLSNLGPSSESSDTGNAFHPPHVVTTPPQQSLASFWSITGQNESEILATILVPSGSVVDIWVDLILYDGETPVTITTTQSGTAGTTYAGYLDGAAGAGLLSPVSYTSLF
jgi:hypothetical protein